MELHYCTEHVQLLLIFSLVATGGASKPPVFCTNKSLAVLGGDVILSCEFKAHLDVLQVTWQKKKEKNTENMVTYSEKYGCHIAEPFQGHVSIISASSRTSSIKLSNLEKKDEACYVCLFNAYPNGAYKGEVSLTNLHPPQEEHPNKVATVAEELDMENANKGDQEIHETQQHYSWVRYLIVLAGVISVMVILSFLYYKTQKRQEPGTPQKLNKAETGQATPICSKNRLDKVNNGSVKVVNSPWKPMYDSEVESPSSNLQLTPSSVSLSSDRSIHKETPDSLLKKRKHQTAGKPTSKKRLDF